MRTMVKRRMTAMAGAVCVTVVAMIATTGPAAGAAPVIDPDATGSITVHKYVQPIGDTGLPNDGAELGETALEDLTPLDGVEFTVYRVGDHDLSTNEGWSAISGMTARDVMEDSAAHPLSEIGRGETVGGRVAFGAGDGAGLPLGLYLVVETGSPENVVTPAEPFLVSIPLPSDDGWLYDVHAYPKNRVTDVAKVVDDSAAYGLGDVVTWTITVDVPSLPAGEAFTVLRIRDTLDERLGFVSASVDLSGDTAWSAGDYTVSGPEAGVSGTVTIDAGPSGLATLTAAQGETITVVLRTSVLSLGDGLIDNEVVVFIDDFEGIDVARTSWGALRVFKYAESEADGLVVSEPLEGAVFQVFASRSDADAGTNPVTVSGRTDFTTGSDGFVTVEGLRAGTYWVVEIAPPVGYIGDDAPREVVVSAGAVEDAALISVRNVQRQGFELPLTGAAGTVLFSIAGAGLVAVALGAAIRGRRRPARHES